VYELDAYNSSLEKPFVTKSLKNHAAPLRIGAVNYLNSKPLIHGLAGSGKSRDGQEYHLLLDLPSRLADSLAAHRVDVALIPSVEFFRNPNYTIVSDACIACSGPVMSVKLFFRVPPRKVQRLALDEGSRTSAALALILLDELYAVSPELEPLPIGSNVSDTDADATLLIGDRAMHPFPESFVEVWDLGEKWCEWSQLPFVFAMWVGHPAANLASIAPLLSHARDLGLAATDEIAEREADLLNIDPKVAASYLRDNLHFIFSAPERQGLLRFYQLCAQRKLVPAGMESMIDQLNTDGCTV
jgi:chorismate dehydratase